MNHLLIRRLSVGLVLIFSLSLIAVLVPSCTRFNSAAEPYQIGHLAPRTGPDQAEGVRLGEAVAQVVEEFNHDEPKGIDGRLITVVHGDSGPDLDGFAYQATRLFAINRVSTLIGGVNVSQLDKLIPPTQTAQAILISPSGGLANPPGKNIWPIGLHPAERGKYLAKFTVDDLKLTEVAIVVDRSHSIYTALGDSFKAEFQHPERRIRSDWSFRDKEELKALPAKIAAAEPKAIVFCGKAQDLLSIISGVRENPKTSAIQFLFGGEEEEAVLLNDAKRSQGVIYTTAFTSADKAEKVQKFCTDFRSRTGQAPDANAAMSADAMRIFLAAARKAQSFKKETLVKELEKLETESLTGPFWFGKDQAARRTIYLMRIDGGAAKLQKSFAPEKQ